MSWSYRDQGAGEDRMGSTQTSVSNAASALPLELIFRVFEFDLWLKE